MSSFFWWRILGSNQPPQRCKRCALPDELIPPNLGGENRICTYSGISHQIYSLAQLSRFGVSPIIFYIELSNSDFLFSKTETTCRNFWSSVFTLRSSNIFFVIFTALNVCSSILIIYFCLGFNYIKYLLVFLRIHLGIQHIHLLFQID